MVISELDKQEAHTTRKKKTEVLEYAAQLLGPNGV